jgi:hypothetical protein
MPSARNDPVSTRKVAIAIERKSKIQREPNPRRGPGVQSTLGAPKLTRKTGTHCSHNWRLIWRRSLTIGHLNGLGHIWQDSVDAHPFASDLDGQAPSELHDSRHIGAVRGVGGVDAGGPSRGDRSPSLRQDFHYLDEGSRHIGRVHIHQHRTSNCQSGAACSWIVQYSSARRSGSYS